MKTPTTTGKTLRVARTRPQLLLSRILDEPELVAMVRALPPRTLGRLIDGRSLRPVEAAETAMAICNSGLDHLIETTANDDASAEKPAQRAAGLLKQYGADRLFRIGWHLSRRGPRRGA